MKLLSSLTTFEFIRQNPKKIIYKKKPFLLLEIMIALSFIVISAPWIMQSSIQYLKAQSEELIYSDLERIADLSFAQIQEDFYAQKVPWNKLKRNKEQALSWPLDDFLISYKTLQFQIERKAQIWIRSEKKGKNHEIFRKICIQLSLKPSKKKKNFTYDFILFAQKIPKHA